MADNTAESVAATEPVRPPRQNLITIFLSYIGELSQLFWLTLREIAKGRMDARNLMEQMAFIGANSVAIAALTSFASGAVIALYFAQFLNQYGASSFVGAVVSLAISRELAPVLTGVVVAARAGSAIAAEIGTMKVTEQIDALRSLAVSPVQYLVVPRLLSALIMLPIVCAIADAAGVVGGYLIAVHLEGVPGSTYPDSIRQGLLPSDFYLGMVKTAVFGLIVAMVGCHQGLKTHGGATEVGRATTNTVVISIVLIYIVNFFLAWAMFTG
jgi:phospholipid/cholesterol/gamma-HCH transport system permease protein